MPYFECRLPGSDWDAVRDDSPGDAAARHAKKCNLGHGEWKILVKERCTIYECTVCVVTEEKTVFENVKRRSSNNDRPSSVRRS